MDSLTVVILGAFLPIAGLTFGLHWFFRNATDHPYKAMGGAALIASVSYYGFFSHQIPFLIFIALALLEIVILMVWVGMNRKAIGLNKSALYMLTFVMLLAPTYWLGQIYFQGILLQENAPKPAQSKNLIRNRLQENVPKPKQAKSLIRNLAVALETYYIDHNTYPPAIDQEGAVVPYTTEKFPVSTGHITWMLTTPIVYIVSIPDDPCCNESAKGWERTFGYATSGLSNWILTSRGPDGDWDMDLAAYFSDASCDIKKYLTQYGGSAVEYDPTNGVTSSGDVFRTGP